MNLRVSSIEISPYKSLETKQVLIGELLDYKHCLQVPWIIDPKLFLQHEGKLTRLSLPFYQIEQFSNMRSLHATLI